MIPRHEFHQIAVFLGIHVPGIALERFYDELVKREKMHEGGPTQKFIAAYCEAYKRRYSTNPPITGRGAGIAKRVVKDLGVDRACDLVDTYLNMNDARFLDQRHSLIVFESQLEKVVVTHDTGKTITRSQIQQAERREQNANAFGKLLGKPRDPG